MAKVKNLKRIKGKRKVWENIGNSFNRFLILIFGFVVGFVILAGIEVKISYNTARAKVVFAKEKTILENITSGIWALRIIGNIF